MQISQNLPSRHSSEKQRLRGTEPRANCLRPAVEGTTTEVTKVLGAAALGTGRSERGRH
jgi:hypothetical protein